jgi:WD40-like Beta Propeller Repeat
MAKHDYQWTFGNQVHISFSGGSAPVNQPNHSFSTTEGCASVADAGGNLLFYTDGSKVYDQNHIPLTAPPLGGDPSSCHSAIIVPPAGGGSHYHIFTVHSWDNNGQGPIYHCTIKLIGGGIALGLPPTPLAFGPSRGAEKLAAIPQVDCGKYWVVALDIPGDNPGPGRFHAFPVDSDVAPTTSVTSPCPEAWHGYCTKFSPDGTLLATTSQTSIDIFNFARSTGLITPHSQVIKIPTKNQYGSAYGLEFSPDGRFLYFTGYQDGYIRRHTIVSVPTNFNLTDHIADWLTPGWNNYFVGALQLAPNGKIYGTKVSQKTLFEIGSPDATQVANINFSINAAQAGGGDLLLPNEAYLGLPTFTRIADDCLEQEDGCAKLAAEVDELIASNELHNSMLTCEGEPPAGPHCEPVDIPPLEPQVYIRWGDSRCDCIEGDDTEIMHLTVCNPYKNVTLSNLVVSQLIVVDANGNPVPNLPSGDPSIELVPIGPHCFDDIAPCTCVTREFVLWLRGAPGGTYHIEVKGICFDACFHGDADACFQFDVCKD